jgi:hypothetical protein
MTNDHARRAGPMFGRRDLMKLGAGVVATALGAPALGAQRGEAAAGRRTRPRLAGVRAPRPADERREPRIGQRADGRTTRRS